MKPWFWEAPREQTERRDIRWVPGGWSEMGRSTGKVVCPFCDRRVLVYLWSLAGCGKRCACGAMLSQTSAFHWKERS